MTARPLTKLPFVSLAVTTGWVLKAVPSPTEPAGEVLKAMVLAAPAVMVTLPVAVALSAPAVALKV